MKLLLGKKTTLYKLPKCSLFIFNETLCLKTEYRTEQGAIEAFIVGSGEMFWGGASTSLEQCKLKVIKVNAK
jgi:hypothetical protein